MLARLWANQIIEEKKTIYDVPRGLRDAVREILIEDGYEELT